jgi:hypothetical protein
MRVFRWSTFVLLVPEKLRFLEAKCKKVRNFLVEKLKNNHSLFDIGPCYIDTLTLAHCTAALYIM